MEVLKQYGEWTIIKNGDGIVASKNHCNPLPGACTFSSVDDAIHGIQCYEKSLLTGESFWTLVRQ